MPTLPERLVAVLSSFGAAGPGVLDELDALYAPCVVFVDPLQQVTSRVEFRKMNERLLARSAALRFDDIAMVGAEPHFMARWTMVLRPHVGPVINVCGASEFRSEGGLVIYHRDYWDLLGSVMSALPVVAPLYRRAVALLG